MDDVLIPFLIESVVLTFIALILQGLSIKQVVDDIVRHERFRALIISHYLTCVANLLFWICSLDSQAGLGLFTPAGIEFLNNSKSYILVASARAVAASFVESYQLVTKGPSGNPAPLGYALLIGHSFAIFFGCTVFAALALSRNAWLGVFTTALIAFYSILVGLQVFFSTLNVRKILVEEFKRTGKYAEGIRKLTRLLVLVIVVLTLGCIAIFMVLAADVKIAHEHERIPYIQPHFDMFHIFDDVTSVLAPAMLLMGAWTSSLNIKKASTSTKSTTLTDTLKRVEANTKEQLPRASNTGTPDAVRRDLNIEVLPPEESIEVVVGSTPVTP